MCGLLRKLLVADLEYRVLEYTVWEYTLAAHLCLTVLPKCVPALLRCNPWDMFVMLAAQMLFTVADVAQPQ